MLLILGSIWLYAEPQPPRQAAPAKSPVTDSLVSQGQPRQAAPPAPTSSPMLAQLPVQPTPRATTPLPAAATPTVGTPSATPSTILVNTPTTVTVTVQITDPTLIAGGVNLLRLGATGTQPTILGVMHDDGKNGDPVAGDQIYTLQVPFNEPTPTTIQLQISAAFKGILKRITTNSISLYVWGTATTQSAVLHFPPTVFVVSSTPTSLLLQTTQLGLTGSGAATDPSVTYASAGYAIELTDISYVGSWNLSSFVNSQFPDSTPIITNLITDGGLTAYELEFSGDSGDYPTTILIPYNNVAHVFSFVVQGLSQSDYTKAESDFFSTVLTMQNR